MLLLTQCALPLAAVTIALLVAALALDVFRMFTAEGYLPDTNNHFRNVLTFAVVLKLIRMLIDTSLGSILCIAGLFAILRIIVNRGDQKKK